VRSFLLFLALYGFWLILSGELKSNFLLVVGALGSLATVILCRRLSPMETPRSSPATAVRFILYLPWLLWQVTLANLDVIRRVWHPKLPIRPRLVRVPTRLSQPLALTLLANSITLTPGTVTVRVSKGELLVHALDDGPREHLLDGSMEKHIAALESEESR